MMTSEPERMPESKRIVKFGSTFAMWEVMRGEEVIRAREERDETAPSTFARKAMG